MKKKYIIGVLVIITIILLVIMSVKDKKQYVYKITVENAQKRSITEIITANGKIQPEKFINN